MATTDLAATMEQASPAAVERPRKSLADYVNDNVEQFERAVGDSAGAELLARILLTEVRRTPRLGECTIESFMGAAMQCAQMRLNPGPLGHCWLIPMKNRRKDPATGEWGSVLECEWWLGYQGMMELGYRSGLVADFHVDDVRHMDHFDVSRGSNGHLVHKIDYKCLDRGETYAYYAFADMVNGGSTWVVLTPPEVEALRGRSPAARSGKGSPWDTDYRAMAMKTALRQLFKWIPTTEGIGPALAADGAVSNWNPARPDVPPQVIDVDATDLYLEDVGQEASTEPAE